jgi:hypothetical protein
MAVVMSEEYRFQMARAAECITAARSAILRSRRIRKRAQILVADQMARRQKQL